MRHFHPLRIGIASVAAAALLSAGAVCAQLRTIPDDAKRGQIRHVREMIVEIDGTQVRLSPGAQIRSRENLIVLPAALPANAQLVKYQLDPGGLVHRVWMLTDEEAARPDKKN